MLRIALGFLASLALNSALAHSPLAPHVHGLAKLDIAVESTALELLLSVPAQSLMGFEHAPQTTQQKAQLAQALNMLKSPATVFEAPGCTWQRAEATYAQDTEHADFAAHYQAHCTPSRISLEPFFKQVKDVHKVQVQLISTHGQEAFHLTAEQPLLELPQ